MILKNNYFGKISVMLDKEDRYYDVILTYQNETTFRFVPWLWMIIQKLPLEFFSVNEIDPYSDLSGIAGVIGIVSLMPTSR